jgi:hypothetical protein
MNARKTAAQFTAYVWFENQEAKATEEEKVQYMKANWNSFLPVAHEGLGRLLNKIAADRSSIPCRRNAPHELELMTVG